MLQGGKRPECQAAHCHQGEQTVFVAPAAECRPKTAATGSRINGEQQLQTYERGNPCVSPCRRRSPRDRERLEAVGRLLSSDLPAHGGRRLARRSVHVRGGAACHCQRAHIKVEPLHDGHQLRAARALCLMISRSASLQGGEGSAQRGAGGARAARCCKLPPRSLPQARRAPHPPGRLSSMKRGRWGSS